MRLFSVQMTEIDGEQRVLLLMQDITPRKRAEEAARAKEALLSALVNNTDDLLLAVDRDLRVTMMNEALRAAIERNYGFVPTLGDDVHRLVVPERQRGARAGVCARAARRAPAGREQLSPAQRPAGQPGRGLQPDPGCRRPRHRDLHLHSRRQRTAAGSPDHPVDRQRHGGRSGRGVLPLAGLRAGDGGGDALCPGRRAAMRRSGADPHGGGSRRRRSRGELRVRPQRYALRGRDQGRDSSSFPTACAKRSRPTACCATWASTVTSASPCAAPPARCWGCSRCSTIGRCATRGLRARCSACSRRAPAPSWTGCARRTRSSGRWRFSRRPPTWWHGPTRWATSAT